MDWLRKRLTEPSTWIGIFGFIASIGVQFVPALKDILTPEFVNAASAVLATLSGVLIGKPAAPTPPANPSA